MGDDELLTSQEVMDALKISRPTLDRLTRTGKLPALRLGGRAPGPGADRRYRRADVRRYAGLPEGRPEPEPEAHTEAGAAA
jgi:excisionase family DNA binding protein